MFKSRRDFLKYSALGTASISLVNIPLPAWADESDDHFYVHFVASGGWDPTYLMDARPLEMTQAELQHNYLNEEPIPYVGSNGTSAFATSLTQKLRSHNDVFSVLNGVVMAHSFDGHGQNMNYLFSGNPFGGESFLPHISKNSKMKETSITGIQSGSLFLQVNNHGEIIPLAGAAGERLVNYMKKSPKVNTQNDLFGFIRDRYVANSQTGGKFSQANKELIHSMDKQGMLYDQIKDLEFDPNNTDVVKQNIELLSKVFGKKVARVAIVTLDPPPPEEVPFFSIDTHFVDDAKKQNLIYGALLDMIVSYIEAMRNTAYDDKRSLMDVTTFMVSSEFSRTMRQHYAKFSDTGTDHNPLSNSLIVGGKGIKAGQVIGQSDFRKSDEVLSGAHLEKDPRKVKLMGRPFDFTTQKPSGKVPAKFLIDDYLNAQSVANTLMSMFGVPEEHHWKLSNSGGAAPILTSLLK